MAANISHQLMEAASEAITEQVTRITQTVATREDVTVQQTQQLTITFEHSTLIGCDLSAKQTMTQGTVIKNAVTSTGNFKKTAQLKQDTIQKIIDKLKQKNKGLNFLQINESDLRSITSALQLVDLSTIIEQSLNQLVDVYDKMKQAKDITWRYVTYDCTTRGQINFDQFMDLNFNIEIASKSALANSDFSNVTQITDQLQDIKVSQVNEGISLAILAVILIAIAYILG